MNATAQKKNVKFIGYGQPLTVAQEFANIEQGRVVGETFENGDSYAGFADLEDGAIWYIAIDKGGVEYATTERPCLRFGIRH